MKRVGITLNYILQVSSANRYLGNIVALVRRAHEHHVCGVIS